MTVSHHFVKHSQDADRSGKWTTIEKSSGELEGLARMIEVVNSGRRVEAHKCAGSAGLTFKYADGSERSFGLLLGRDDRFCEVAENGVFYRVPKEAFFEAVAALEIDWGMLSDGTVVEQGLEPTVTAAEQR